MDDIKIVLYILAAIAWVIFNNYKKLSETHRKRDSSKPPPDIIPENFPPVSETPDWKKLEPEPSPRKITMAGEPVKAKRTPFPRHSISQRKSKPARSAFFNQEHEGGEIIPSQIVHFEEGQNLAITPHPIIEYMHSGDLRSAVLLSEILRRPYN